MFDGISYWAPAEARNIEVDFILTRGSEHLAIEVKSSTRVPDKTALLGLDAISYLPKLRRRLAFIVGALRLALRTVSSYGRCTRFWKRSPRRRFGSSDADAEDDGAEADCVAPRPCQNALMNDLECLLSALRDATGTFLLAMQTDRAIRPAEFARIERISRECAEALKGLDALPRLLLLELYSTVQIMRNEAPYLGHDKDRVLEMAEKLDFTFALILKGESHIDRAPNRPRII